MIYAGIIRYITIRKECVVIKVEFASMMPTFLKGIVILGGGTSRALFKQQLIVLNVMKPVRALVIFSCHTCYDNTLFKEVKLKSGSTQL